ncbi:hypothetical protein BVJ53_07320 [Lacticaseibacillus chiayiensis]|uniref:Antitoxin SocA-like Panacea domain-containing protein n=1 Tax=Lacticaseibacillus chiayiensis TaxID=2100821 RepID=A0A4Q1TZE4_9LACO|nr:type II toxin-antitoxin system antitoxin SocA domain-containing protein [Lacticaseibacillus chiayiensis]RXT17738.1 hypothetical protein BVJ53_14345 [Lacticaseibacillus chiayiensis]RXT24554.1 hypothetical protein BVJ53_07320 [Lacticaseibacillus chiayiensis]
MEQHMSYKDVAAWFLSKSAMSPKKLQKLVYYFQAWGNALLHYPVIDDTYFEAWPHGPVSMDLYQDYKKYGWTDIEKGKPIEINSENLDNLLESVWVTYGDKSANELEALTHKEMPWKKARAELGPGEHSNKRIADEDMKEFYQSIYSGD